MKKKLVCLVLALAMIMSIVFTGCGSSGNAPANGTSANSTSASSTSANSTSAAASTAAQKTEITFQTWNPAETSCIHDIINKFQAANPDITVNYKYMPASDHIQALKVGMSSGDGPDVYGMNTGAPYSDFRDFEEELTPYAKAAWGDNWHSKFFDFCMKLLNVDGKYYGLPLGLTYAGFGWADATMLKKYGINDLPTSYDSLLKDSKILRKNKQFPLAIGAKDAWINVDTWMSMANDVNSEKLYSALDGKTPFTDPDLVKSFEIWQNCFKDGIFQDGAVGMTLYNDVNDMFQREGSIPMILNGSWAMNMYLLGDKETQKVFNSSDSDHEVFLIDWNNDGKACPVTSAVDVTLCMYSESKAKDSAFKFINYMVNEGQDELINGHMEYCPSRADLKLDVKGLSENGKKNLDFIMKNAQNNLAGIRTIAYSDLQIAIQDQLAALATNSITPQKAAEAVETASKAVKR